MQAVQGAPRSGGEEPCLGGWDLAVRPARVGWNEAQGDEVPWASPEGQGAAEPLATA